MQNTDYLKLNVPELTDKADILKLGENMVDIDDVVKSFNKEHATIERRLLRLELNAGVVPEQALADALESIREEVTVLSEKVYVVSQDFTELSEEHKRDIEAVDAKIVNLQEQIDELSEKMIITIDTDLSATSTNPVENRAVTLALESTNAAVSGLSNSVSNINREITAINTNISEVSSTVNNISSTVTMIDEYFTLMND